MLLFVVSLYWLIIDCYLRRMLEPDNVIGYPISFGLIIGLWLYLTRETRQSICCSARCLSFQDPDNYEFRFMTQIVDDIRPTEGTI